MEWQERLECYVYLSWLTRVHICSRGNYTFNQCYNTWVSVCVGGGNVCRNAYKYHHQHRRHFFGVRINLIEYRREEKIKLYLQNWMGKWKFYLFHVECLLKVFRFHLNYFCHVDHLKTQDMSLPYICSARLWNKALFIRKQLLGCWELYVYWWQNR